MLDATQQIYRLERPQLTTLWGVSMRVEAFGPQGSWKKAQASAALAERAGFDSYASPEIAHDPFTPLAFAAVGTTRIGLRTAIAVAFARSPMVLASTAWDLNAESHGRFSLGLGTQVKAHNERRFSVKWEKPKERLKEYVLALRAIWRSWEKKERLDFVGKHYQFTLMTPEFSPEPMGLAPIPIYTAAVRPAMLELAGEVCDGVRLHGFATRKYLEEVALPCITKGLQTRNKDRKTFEVCGGGFIVTGEDEASVRESFEHIRYRLAFYGSTPAYQPVFELHGWQELGAKLHALSRSGKWDELARAVPDEVVHAFSAVATHDDLAGAVRARFAGISDCVELSLPETMPVERVREILASIQAIESPCKGVTTSWE
jgi:probable F420-dependent oxidoreductase